MSHPADVTLLLNELSGGDRSAMDRLVPAIYDDLRQIAHSQLRRERADHTLNTTALVHEAYLKLARVEDLTWRDRAHFFGVCAGAMRRILVDYARMKGRKKRGSGASPVPLTDVVVAARERPDDLLVADQALTRLAALNQRHAQVVEFRVFGGMSVEDIAEVLDVSVTTVKRDWSSARAWLNRELLAGGS